MGINQSQMGALLGVTRNYVSMIEAGRPPSKAVQINLDALYQKHFPAIPTESESSEVEATPIQSELNTTESYLEEPTRKWYEVSAKGLTEAAQHVEGLPLGAAAKGILDTLTGVTGARAKLKEARIAKGLTVKQAAKEIGYPSTAAYQEIEDGRSSMGEKMARRAAAVLGIDVAELLSGSDEVPSRDGPFGTFGAVPDVQVAPGQKAKFVPLLSMAQCGGMHAYDDSAYAKEGFLVFNAEDPKAFAVTLAGDSMVPRFEPGDVAIIYPSKPPRNGKVVIAKLDSEHGEDVMLKLFQASRDEVTLSSYNPAYPPMTYPRSAFQWIYPVGQVTKLL